MTPVTVKHEPQAPAKIDKSPKKQAQRPKLIAHLIDLRVFDKVETVSPTPVHVYAMPGAFNSLRFEIKQSYVSAVFTAGHSGLAPSEGQAQPTSAFRIANVSRKSMSGSSCSRSSGSLLIWNL
jgi:hypothetical protein